MNATKGGAEGYIHISLSKQSSLKYTCSTHAVHLLWEEALDERKAGEGGTRVQATREGGSRGREREEAGGARTEARGLQKYSKINFMSLPFSFITSRCGFDCERGWLLVGP
jgi:hypothetical protein